MRFAPPMKNVEKQFKWFVNKGDGKPFRWATCFDNIFCIRFGHFEAKFRNIKNQINAYAFNGTLFGPHGFVGS